MPLHPLGPRVLCSAAALFALVPVLAGFGAVEPRRGNRLPVGEQLTSIEREPGGVTILPTGRAITPRGRQVEVPPHPYGLALSRDGEFLVASCNGARPFALAIVGGPGTERPDLSLIEAAAKGEVKSFYQGAAISPDGRTLYASGGDDGRVHLYDLPSRRHTGSISLDGAGYSDSLSAQLALSPDGRTLLAVDQGNYRLCVIDTASGRVAASARAGRTPFDVRFSPDGKAAYVANIGVFEYRPIEGPPGADPRLPFPPFGYPSVEATVGARIEGRLAPGLGRVTPEAYSVWGCDLSDPAHPKQTIHTITGVAVGRREEGEGEREREGEDEAVGGSAPCALLVTGARVYVSNANNDSIQAIDRASGRILGTVELTSLLPERLERLRGMAPYGLALAPDGKRLYAALAGFNAVAVIDPRSLRVRGMIPTAWYPSRVALSPDGKRLYVSNAKGCGSGPNGGRSFQAGPAGSSVGALMRGTLSLMDVPADRDLPALTRAVLRNNGVVENPPPAPRKPPVRYVLFITKENRTFDEVFGALPGVRGDAALARFGRRQPLEGIPAPVVVMPNHVQLARRFTVSDNFYVDSDHSADGHRWLVAVAPNHWTESAVSAAYGGAWTHRTDSPAPGRRAIFGANSSVTPEDYPEAGTLWHHLERHRIPFRNWGEGMEFAGIDEGPGLKPTGARLPLNIPMPAPLFKATSRDYPTYNTNIPDQYRADVFLREFRQRYESGKEPLPRYMYLYLPNDHGADPRPADGYPQRFSYMADNDLALGRIMAGLSRSRFWKDMAVFVTEDDAQGGIDSVDAHRSVLMVLSPWAKRGYVSRRHADIASIHRETFRLLGLPPLSLWDALAGDLSDVWSDKPDLSPYHAVGVDPRLFDPEKARDPKDPEFHARRPNSPVDDPEEVARLRRAEGFR